MKITNNNTIYSNISNENECAGYMPGLFCNNNKQVGINNQIFDRSKLLERKVHYMQRPDIMICKKYIADKNQPDLHNTKTTFSKYIDKDSYVRRLNKDNDDKCSLSNIDNINNNTKMEQTFEIDDVSICNRPYPKIAIKNSYPSCNLPNGLKDCKRNLCMNTKPFQMCINEDSFNKKQCLKHNWHEYSRINDLSENMIKNTRFYTDKNTYPFILNHIAVNKPQQCYDQFCLPLFNMNTSKNSIDGKCVYDKELNNKYNKDTCYKISN